MQRAVLHAIYRLLFALRKFYWRIVKPRTYGVRVLVRHPDSGAVLLIRHSYGARHLWCPPGGGYRPTKESAEDAARREVREEVGVELGRLEPLGQYYTEKAGNRDSVMLFAADVVNPEVCASAEISQFVWFQLQGLDKIEPLARITEFIIQLYNK